MKAEIQRIAIAEACGLKPMMRHEMIGDKYIPIQGTEDWSELPDYPSDLNAIHEAEKVFTEDQCTQYGLALNTIMDRDDNSEHVRQISDWHATAAQRAEAFLRTIGKWTDE